MKPFLLFLLLLLLFPALGVLVDWLQADQAPQAWWQWALIIALPGLVWLYVRYFSLLACRQGCRLPERRD